MPRRRFTARGALIAAFPALLLGASLALAPAAGAQQRDTLAVRDTTAPDSLARPGRLLGTAVRGGPPISPRRAFLYSFLVPGLGQSRLDRPTGGALFAFVEMGAVLMARKAADDLRQARRHASDSIALGYEALPDTAGNPVPTGFARNRYAARVRSRRTQYEDWLAVIVFNHLFAGADAFVAAQLWDMPVRASLRPTGARGAVVQATIELGRAR